MGLQIFTSLRSQLFPDGTEIRAYRQGEAFHMPITARNAADQTPVDLSADTVEIRAEFYLANVRVLNSTEATISNMRLMEVSPELPANPRTIDVRENAGAFFADIPEDLFPPNVKLNESKDVPVAACQVILTTAGGTIRKGWFGVIIRRGI